MLAVRPRNETLGVALGTSASTLVVAAATRAWIAAASREFRVSSPQGHVGAPRLLCVGVPPLVARCPYRALAGLTNAASAKGAIDYARCASVLI
jgi:hypothetical protein